MHFKIKSPPLRHPPPPSALSLRPPLSSLLPSYFRDRSYGHPPNKAPGTRRHQAQGTRHKAPGTRHKAPVSRHHSPGTTGFVLVGVVRRKRLRCWAWLRVRGRGRRGGGSFGVPPQSVTDLEGTLGAGLEPGPGTGCGHVRPHVVPPPPAPPSSAQGQLPQHLENIAFSN